MSNAPAYSGTDEEITQQALAIMSEGHCPFCGVRAYPYTDTPPEYASLVRFAGVCSTHGLTVATTIEPGPVFHHVTVFGMNGGAVWWEWL